MSGTIHLGDFEPGKPHEHTWTHDDDDYDHENDEDNDMVCDIAGDDNFKGGRCLRRGWWMKKLNCGEWRVVWKEKDGNTEQKNEEKKEEDEEDWEKSLLF